MRFLGLQIPNFTYPDTSDAELFETVARIALEAEASGYERLMVMDHFYQLPTLGPPEHNMLEAYTLLGALAARTKRLRLGTLVSGNTYRNPAHLAKIVTTLDIVSGGRAILGLGAGWFEPEHVAYGFDYPPIGQRLDRLDEALSIIRGMFRGEKPSASGPTYQTQEALNIPAPLQPGGPAILIGGAGEKKTLRLVAKYADESNLTSPREELPRKLEVLEKHCADLGRDRSEIRVSWLGSVVVAPTHEEAVAQRNAFLLARGMDWDKLPEPVQERIGAMLLIGDADSVGEIVEREICAVGLDGLIVNLPGNGHIPGAVAYTAEALLKALG